ncbi:MAG: hypothetical protein QM758_14090 [Armatimonas sp.]
MKRATFWGGALAGAVIALSGVYVLEQAKAQDPGLPRQGGQGQGGFPGRPGGQGGFGGGFGGGQGGGFPGGPPMGMMGMGGGGGASITATDKYVYVLRGNTLYQFAAEGLKMLGKAELPQPPRPQGLGGQGGGAFGDPPPPPSNEEVKAEQAK